MKRTVLILMILSLNFCCAIFAQTQEYIITTKNDTIKCKIKKTLISEALVYKPENATDFMPLKLDSVNEYYYRKDKVPTTRRALPGESGMYFVRWEIRGRINFYGYYVWYGNHTQSTYYAAKGNDSLTIVKLNNGAFIKGEKTTRTQRKEAFYKLIGDFPELLEKFKVADDYSFQNLFNTITEYNKFKEEHQ